MNDGLKWNGTKVLKAVEKAGIRGQLAAAETILEVSNQRVPLDKGELRDSGHVTQGEHQTVISYDCPYAVKWHETPAHFQHGRRNKYLQSAVEDEAQNALKQLAKVIDKELR
ncbi:MAG: hypothetical protein CVU90_02015 [Firmicutes bacterium HGW-Firmicutes-15]|nr:MAG: hypothetical protein CVU90_02015 [Firmicutes bacterium HGW-Firmicutes-15]